MWLNFVSDADVDRGLERRPLLDPMMTLVDDCHDDVNAERLTKKAGCFPIPPEINMTWHCLTTQETKHTLSLGGSMSCCINTLMIG